MSNELFGLINNPTNDLTLEQLSILEKLSQRTINVCNATGLKTLSEIFQFKIINSGFLRIRNCGAKSNEELIRICDKYLNFFIRNSDNGDFFVFENANPLSSKEKQIEENVVTLKENISLETLADIEGLSIRSYNVCKLADLSSLQSLLEYYYNHKRAGFLSIKHCGQKSNAELIKICLKYENTISSVNKGIRIENQIFSPIDNFVSNLRLKGCDYHLIKNNISGLSYIPAFKVTNLLIDSNAIFRKEKLTQIFKLTFNCYLPLYDFTLEKVGKSVGLTRERVRQIRENIFKRLRYIFKFLHTNDFDTLFPKYIECLEKPIVLLNDEEINKLNKDEGTNFSHLFITYLLSIIYADHFVRIGDIRTLFGNDIFKKNYLFKHLFLVNRSIASDFQFEKFLRHLDIVIYERRCENEFISYTEIINRFKASESIDFESVICAIKTIIVNDFSPFIQAASDGILLLSNSKRTLVSLVQEILHNSYKPLHFTEIYKMLIENGGDVTSEQSVHSLLNREKDLFGLKGSGIFDLKAKGGLFGSIGDVAEQILRNRKKPIPMQELENLICSELIVSKDSIGVILFNYANENRFIKYRNGNVTLAEW